jgi:hypothetical protein
LGIPLVQEHVLAEFLPTVRRFQLDADVTPFPLFANFDPIYAVQLMLLLVRQLSRYRAAYAGKVPAPMTLEGLESLPAGIP